MRRNETDGFTLVEMLVTVAVVALLASVVMFSVSGAQKKARDDRRVAELEQIMLAVKLYQNVEGHWPLEDDESDGTFNGMICEECSGPLNDILEAYMGDVPTDPLHDGSDYYYYYDGAHACYQPSGTQVNYAVLVAHMENEARGNVAEASAQYNCDSWGPEGGVGTPGSYTIVLGLTSG